jgi:hypothetical protein
MTIQDLQARFDVEKNDLAEMRIHCKQPPVLYTHWAFGSPSNLKKLNRIQWQKQYKMRKAFRDVTESEYFQIRLRGLYLF